MTTIRPDEVFGSNNITPAGSSQTPKRSEATEMTQTFNYDAGEIGDGFSTQGNNENNTNNIISSMQSYTQQLENIVKKGDFSGNTIEKYNDIKEKIEDLQSRLFNVDLNDEQWAIYDKATDLITQIKINFSKTEIKENVKGLEKAFKNSKTTEEFVTVDLINTRDRIMSEIREDNMTESESKVYNILKKAIQNEISDESQLKSITGYNELSADEKTALAKAFNSSSRIILESRIGSLKTEPYPKSINKNIPPSSAEMVFWVKNVYDDFGINNPKGVSVMDYVVQTAVSEKLYDNTNPFNRNITNNDNYYSTRRNGYAAKGVQPTSITRAVVDDAEEDLIQKGKMTSSENKVKQYWNARRYDKDGGDDSSTASTYSKMAEELTGFNPAKENFGKITRKRQ